MLFYTLFFCFTKLWELHITRSLIPWHVSYLMPQTCSPCLLQRVELTNTDHCCSLAKPICYWTLASPPKSSFPIALSSFSFFMPPFPLKIGISQTVSHSRIPSYVLFIYFLIHPFIQRTPVTFLLFVLYFFL